jgi:hypothetical protein
MVPYRTKRIREDRGVGGPWTSPNLQSCRSHSTEATDAIIALAAGEAGAPAMKPMTSILTPASCDRHHRGSRMLVVAAMIATDRTVSTAAMS